MLFLRKFIFPAVFILILGLVITGCDANDSLTEKEALKIIRARYEKMPEVKTETIQIGRIYDGDVETRGHNAVYESDIENIGPAPEPSWPFGDHYQLYPKKAEYLDLHYCDYYEQLEKQDYLKLSIKKKLLKKDISNYNGWCTEYRTYSMTVGVDLTSKGKRLFKQAEQGKWSVDLYEKDVEITGISLDEGGTTAVVEFQEIIKPKVDQEVIQAFDSPRLQTNQRVNMRKWDDGWRIEQ